jgi:hypothetical protein
MRTFTSFIVVLIVFGVTMAIGVPIATKQLHEATIRQCTLHQWPSHQAEAHIEFCKEYMAANK